MNNLFSSAPLVLPLWYIEENGYSKSFFLSSSPGPLSDSKFFENSNTQLNSKIRLMKLSTKSLILVNQNMNVAAEMHRFAIKKRGARDNKQSNFSAKRSDMLALQCAISCSGGSDQVV